MPFIPSALPTLLSEFLSCHLDHAPSTNHQPLTAPRLSLRSGPDVCDLGNSDSLRQGRNELEGLGGGRKELGIGGTDINS